MNAATLQSSVNTIKNWYVRRQAQGKPVSHAEVVARVKSLWPDVSPEDAIIIADKVAL